MTDKNIPVLKKDTDLKFPHALLISASAGSGKTYTLTQRYVQLLLSTKVPLNGIENILAVTFTNNAAKEMKSRILNWFKELALDEHCPKMAETLNLVDMTSGDIHKKSQKIVERILSDYSNFHVQTIDSFFARVMGCSVAELGLPLKPNITMTYDALMDLALYSMFAKIGSKELNKKTIERFLNIMPKGNAYPWNPIIKVRDNFKDFLNEEGKTGGDIKWDDFDFDAEIKRGFSDIMKFCAKIEEKLKNADLLKTFYFAAKENGNISVFLSSYKYDYGILKGNRKKSLYDSWEKDIALLNNMVLKLSELNSKAYYHPYVLIFRKFISELDRVKNGKREVLHISDIAKKLSAYINKNNVPEIYLKLGERISHFLVDEFQDTNKLQWDNMLPLMEEALSKSGSLFAVGDIKQAIYMFRNADYKIMRDFLDVAEGKKDETSYLSLASVSSGLELKNLPVNYRSDGKLLDFTENIFKEKIKNLTEIIGSDETELTSFIQSPAKGKEETGSIDTRVFEVENIEDDMAEKEPLIAAVRKAEGKYPLNEIAVLVAKNKRIEPVVEWLTEAGIPVASLSSLDIRKRKAVSEMIAFLKFLETPADNLSFASFILGDVFGKETNTDRTEIEKFIFNHHKGEILYAAFKEDAKFKKIWDEYFEDLFKKVGYLPLYELITLAFSKFRLFENFKDEAAFLAKFLDAAIKLETEGASSLREFINFAQGDDDDKTVFFSIELPDFIDAVRVMSFHKSKGLGFSAVINLIYDEKTGADPMYFSQGEEGIDIWHITKTLADESRALGAIYKNKKQDERVQDLNTLYVILTRAKHEMYNFIIKKARKTPRKEPAILDVFEDFKAQGKEDKKTVKIKKDAPAPVAVLSPQSSQVHEFKGHKPTYDSHFETARGNLCHDILSDFITIDNEKKIDPLYDKYSKLYEFDFDKAKIIKAIKAFVNLPAVKSLFSNEADRAIKTEMEFTDKNGSLRRMDRVIIDKDKITVMDFKTGAESDGYQKQMTEYMAILSEVYKKPVEGFIGYIDLKKIVNVED